jgi:bacillolysin
MYNLNKNHMKHFYNWRYLISLTLIFSTTGVFAQKADTQKQGKIETSSKNSTGVYQQIKFNVNENQIPAAQAKDVLKSYLELKSEDDMRVSDSKIDKIGMEHVKYNQFYNDIKVEFGTYIVHNKSGVVESMNGDFERIENLNTAPSISPDQALNRAMNHIGGKKYLWENAQEASVINYEKPKGELVILKGKLAYKLDVYATEPLSRDHVYVDAHSGEILFKNQIIKHAVAAGTAATRYSGSRAITTDSNAGTYRLRDLSRGLGVETYDMNNGTNYASGVDFVDNDNNWTSAEWNNAAKDNAALDAHWGAMMTYDYFSSVHGRNSYNGAGAKIKSYVHYSSNYENAFWNGSVMTYGDGATRFDVLTSLDVAAHEIGHAVCETTANLVYSYESGAMNEGFSDIWGASVEFFAAPEKSEWLIGEDIDKQRPSLRSMSNPKAEGQPDTYLGTNWATGSADNGGVHTNSGVLNHWYYILSVGKTGVNDIGTSYAVTGLTISKAAAIAYRTESVYLTSNSQYADARTYSIQSAADLYGAGSNEVIQTTNAWNAVGLGGKYGEISYCTSKGNSVADEYIGRVQLGSINNVTGASAGGYADYTTISASLAKGASATITITPTWTGTKYNEGYSVWIDYNKDGDFADAGEQVWTKAASQTTPVSGSFTVPTSATTGTTRMRVSMKYNGVPTACEAFSYGEVEDYGITIGASSGDTQAPTTPTSLTASGITQTSANMAWTASTDNVGVTGYNVYKGGVLIGSPTGTSYSVTGLSAGTTYAMTVKAKDAAGNLSAAASVNVTTPGAATTDVALTLKFDNYPEETSWQIKSGATVVASGGTYGAQADGSTLVVNVTLNNACYDLVMLDAYGDGMCCAYGSGSYSLKAGTTVLASGGSFASSQTTAFCVGGAVLNGISTGSLVSSEGVRPDGFSVYPNPTSGVLNVFTGKMGAANYTIINAAGKVWKAGSLSGNQEIIDIQDLKAGFYFLRVTDGQNVVIKKVIKQ